MVYCDNRLEIVLVDAKKRWFRGNLMLVDIIWNRKKKPPTIFSNCYLQVLWTHMLPLEGNHKEDNLAYLYQEAVWTESCRLCYSQEVQCTVY